MKRPILLLSILFAVTSYSAEFSKGIDFTGVSAINGSMLNQLVDAAKPATNRGLVIVGTTTPDTTTYPYLTNYVWKDISTVPPVLRFYNPSNSVWEPVLLGSGTIQTYHISDNAVTSAKIGTGAILSRNIGTNVISEINISDSAVSSAKVRDGAITTAKLFDASVTGAKIANNTIDAANLKAGSVTTSNLVDNSVTSDKVASSSITNRHYAPNSIPQSALQANIVNRTNLMENSVAATNIVDGAITHSKIGAGLLKTHAWIFFTVSGTGAGQTINTVEKYNISSFIMQSASTYKITFSNQLSSTTYFVDVPPNGRVYNSGNTEMLPSAIKSATANTTDYTFTYYYRTTGEGGSEFMPNYLYLIVVYGP